MSNKDRNPNDDRSDVKNPNNPAYEHDRANREQLGHDEVPPPPPLQKQEQQQQ